MKYNESPKSNLVLVLDTNRNPVDPVHPAKARILLKNKQASVFRRHPYTIIVHGLVKDKYSKKTYKVKIDPGSKHTGIAVIDAKTLMVVWAMTLHHRGQSIKMSLQSRRQLRRSRRSRKTRYRQPRFDNRTRPSGWLPPSLMSRIANVQTWITRLNKYLKVDEVIIENVSFDTHKMLRPGIRGKQYQKGVMEGYGHTRAYVLARDNYTCQYCGTKSGKLEVDHVIPRSKGGIDHHSNLVCSCTKCNRAKGSMTIEEFLKHDRSKIAKVKSRLRSTLRDATIVTATKNKLLQVVKSIVPNTTTSDAITTYMNRTSAMYRKEHWIDAACVGNDGYKVQLDPNMVVLDVTAMGRGNRQMVRTDKYGFPRSKPKTQSYLPSQVGNLRTGDVITVKTDKPSKYLPADEDGNYTLTGRITALNIPLGRVVLDKLSVMTKYVTDRLHMNDGYKYELAIDALN